MFRVVVAMESYALRDRRVAQAFKFTFEDKLCPISVLKAGSYIQSQLDSLKRKDNQIYVAEAPNVVEVLMWYHCVNLIYPEVEIKHMFVRMNYPTGNIIAFFDAKKESFCLDYSRTTYWNEIS